MKKYILKIVLFFAIILAIDMAFGKACNYMTAHAKGGDTKQMYDLCMTNQYDILIMGSSRAHHHYVPQIVQDSLGMTCYNAGYDGNGIICMDGIYQMIRSRYKPELIIYDLTLGFDAYEYPEDKNDTRYLSQLKPYFYEAGIGKIFRDVSKEEYLKAHSSLMRFNSKTLSITKEYLTNANMYDLGYAPLKSSMTEKEPSEELPSNAKLDERKMSHLERFIKQVKSDGVDLVFVLSPRYKSLSREMFEPVLSLAENYEVPVLDYYSGDLSIKYNLFKDAAHLNSDGAVAFSEKLTTDIKNIKQ